MRAKSMRVRFAAVVAAPLLLVAAASTASAQNYPWCAQYGGMWGGGGGRNCGFVTYQQCMATVSGVGGYCERNAMYRPGYAGAPRKPRRHRR
jgi:Protein of unknown function (DUF3551)